MALTISFTSGSVCAGGAHFTITAQPSAGPALTIGVDRITLRTPLSLEEREQFLQLLLRILVMQVPPGTTAAQVKTALAARIVDLSFTVV